MNRNIPIQLMQFVICNGRYGLFDPTTLDWDQKHNNMYLLKYMFISRNALLPISPVNLGPKWAEPTTNCNKNQISTML